MGNIDILFEYAFRYTNFSLNAFRLTCSDEFKTNAKTGIRSLDVKIYRFWSYDLANNVPNETAYFLKMANIINAGNPIFYKNKYGNLRKPAYPIDNADSHNIANYIMHSE